ncbi:MAG TPA: S46 family peptidase [Polyangiaceae bacterium]|nr:S46 family peptidase [Polyangiaceae bacterium]
MIARRTRRLAPLAAFLLLPLLACDEPPRGAPPPAVPKPPPAPAAVAPAPAPKPEFQNPGGKWMPEQLAAHAETLKKLGLEVDPQLLTDPTSPVLGAVVSLGGCSASFVSPEGLIVTNHHCVTGALQVNSTPEKNLVKDGFLAKARADEKSAGASARVFVTQAFRDVTDKVLSGVEGIKDDRARYKEIEKRTKELTAACEKGRAGLRCTVARFFDGERFYQIEQLELRDVRLVYAPDAGIGNFGGEVDNWRWPRHTGDFSFYRAYVGKDGQPADFAADNVPYRPKHHLRLAQKAVEPGDLVLVAGYPGRTSRLRTATEVREAVEWFYPRRIKAYEEYLREIDAAGKEDKEAMVRGQALARNLNNYLTNGKGQLEGLVKGGLLAKKEQQESALAAWVEADPARRGPYGGALEKLAALHAETVKHRENDAFLREALQMVRLLDAAASIVRMAEERPKPDAERHPEYQERNWNRLSQGLATAQKFYSRGLDRALLSLALRRIARQPPAERSPLLKVVTGGATDDAAIKKAVDAIYAGTKLEDEATRQKLFKTASSAELAKSADPLVRLAVKLRPLLREMDERDERVLGAQALVRPRYVKALRELSGGVLAPDANGTLRVTYGTVRGYRPAPDAPPARPFTTLGEVLTKTKGVEPFASPERLVAAARAKKYGPYVDPGLGDVPVDFLSDVDITGGNSGSAALNGRGELIGLAFDGVYENVASDWFFQPELNRTIHVDARYMRWVMDAVDGADHLLREMGAQPAVDG